MARRIRCRRKSRRAEPAQDLRSHRCRQGDSHRLSLRSAWRRQHQEGRQGLRLRAGQDGLSIRSSAVTSETYGVAGNRGAVPVPAGHPCQGAGGGRRQDAPGSRSWRHGGHALLPPRHGVGHSPSREPTVLAYRYCSGAGGRAAIRHLAGRNAPGEPGSGRHRAAYAATDASLPARTRLRHRH